MYFSDYGKFKSENERIFAISTPPPHESDVYDLTPFSSNDMITWLSVFIQMIVEGQEIAVRDHHMEYKSNMWIGKDAIAQGPTLEENNIPFVFGCCQENSFIFFQRMHLQRGLP